AGAVGRERGRNPVIDVGAQRMQRHAALAVPLHAGDLGAAEPAGAVDTDALVADCTARFMARRNATRRSSCWAIDSATSCASSSGFRISTMLMTTSLSVSAATF